VAAEELGALSGRALYTRFCAACHGAEARGDGPVAPFFKLSPPDLTRLAKRRGGEFPAEQVGRIIDGRDVKAPHGAREMPVWGMEFYFADPAQSDAGVQRLVQRLVEYLKSIQQP
jgi:mono/diheme cytochrome c family protein